MSRITIVSDSLTNLNAIESKLVLLRSDDSVLKCSTSDIVKGTSNADIILFNTPQITDITLAAISNIKRSNNVIILLVEGVDPKALLDAYDLGINDYCGLDVTNFELLIKIINAKKFLKQYNAIERLKTQLREKGVIKPASDVYTKISEIVNANFFKEIANSTMLSISIEESSRQEFIQNNIEGKLPSILREGDFIINYADFKYLIILPNTELQNGVFEKIRKKFNLDIKGVAFRYNGEYAKEILKKIELLEVQRDKKGLDFWTSEKAATDDFETETDWLSEELSEEAPKNYKLFQNIFNKKLETAVEPAFYRTKQKYEKNFKNTKIKYFTDKNRAEFLIINFDKTNSLQIIYKNSAKVGINLQYSGIDSPENSTFEIPFSKLNTRSLTEILEGFVAKFEGEENELARQ